MPESELSAFEQRLAALEARYVELEELLSAPDAYQDLDRVQNLSREQAKLREVVESARRWRDNDAAILAAFVLDLHDRDAADLARARDVHTATGLKIHQRVGFADPHQPQPMAAAWEGRPCLDWFAGRPSLR